MPKSLNKQGSLIPIQGLDSSQPGEFINERNSPNLQNIRVDRSVIRKREGTTVQGAALGEFVMRGVQFTRQGVNYNVRIGPTKIQYYTAGAWTNIAGSALSATTSDPVDIATPLLTGQKILTITNYINNIRKWTGSGNTADLGGSPPKCKYMCAYKDYLVLGYINDGNVRASRVQWPDTASPETWTGGNSGAKDLNDDDEEITAVALYGEYVAVHKKTCIYLGYLVDTSSIFKFDRKSTGSGAIAHTSIQSLPTGEQIYLATDGIRLFNGTSSRLIESPVTDELRQGINYAYTERTWSLIVPEFNEVWIGVAIGSQTTPDTVYKYNYITGSCHKDYRPNTMSAWNFDNVASLTWDEITTSWDSSGLRWDDNSLGTDVPVPMFGGSDQYTTYKDPTVSNDNTVAINASWESKDFESAIKGQICRWQLMEMWAKGNTVDVDYSIDAGANWINIVTQTLDSDYPSDDLPDILYFDVWSSKIRFRFRNTEPGQTFYLKQFVVSYKPREMRT